MKTVLRSPRALLGISALAAACALFACAGNRRWGYLFKTLATLCDLLSVKADLGRRIRAAYLAGDRETVRKIATEVIPSAVEKLDVFTAAFRDQWFRENRTFGFSTEDQRLGGLRARLLTSAERLIDWADGKVAAIEELEEPRLWVDGRRDDDKRTPYISYNRWTYCVTSGLI